MTINTVKSSFSSTSTASTTTSSKSDVSEKAENSDKVEKIQLTENEKEMLKVVSDMKRFAQTHKTSLEKQKAYLVLEAKCRKIYNNMMVGKKVASSDKHYLLENKPHLYAIAKNLGKKIEDAQRAEKIVKRYEQIRDLESTYKPSSEILLFA